MKSSFLTGATALVAASLAFLAIPQTVEAKHGGHHHKHGHKHVHKHKGHHRHWDHHRWHRHPGFYKRYKHYHGRDCYWYRGRLICPVY